MRTSSKLECDNGVLRMTNNKLQLEIEENTATIRRLTDKAIEQNADILHLNRLNKTQASEIDLLKAEISLLKTQFRIENK